MFYRLVKPRARVTDLNFRVGLQLSKLSPESGSRGNWITGATDVEDQKAPERLDRLLYCRMGRMPMRLDVSVKERRGVGKRLGAHIGMSRPSQSEAWVLSITVDRRTKGLRRARRCRPCRPQAVAPEGTTLRQERRQIQGCCESFKPDPLNLFLLSASSGSQIQKNLSRMRTPE
jgi:hypothetical protein